MSLVLLVLRACQGHHSMKYHEFSKQEIATFRTCLLEWYDKNKRDLPWRMSNDDYREWDDAQKGYRGIRATIDQQHDSY
jgi:hypothetical protein